MKRGLYMVDGWVGLLGFVEFLLGAVRVHEWYARGLVQRCVFVCINLIWGDAKRLPFILLFHKCDRWACC